MKRHGDRKAYLRERGKSSFQWSGRVGDRASQQQRNADSSDDMGTPLLESLTPIAGIKDGASPSQEPKTVLSLMASPAQDAGGTAGKRRLVTVGEHHEGSMGVYMAHKMDKLRHQVDGAVARLEGPDGNVFRGVVAYINGYTTVPVATLRELLASRGGVIEAYNTPRCTHMICEALPYAKIRELRKLLHPPSVVRSSWVEDSAHAGRKLPVAEYMVDGVFVQKRTLAASFASAATPKPPSDYDRRNDERSFTGSGGGQGQSAGGACVPRSAAPGHQDSGGNDPSAVVCSDRSSDDREVANVASRAAAKGKGKGKPVEGTRVTPPVGDSGEDETLKGGDGPQVMPSEEKKRTVSSGRRATISPLYRVDPPAALAHRGEGTGSGGGLDESPGIGAEGKHEGDERPLSKPGDEEIIPPWEIPGMGAAGEGGRSTRDDPTFMKTFFHKSRLHFIGVGRANAVKVVNAGLAARAKPGGVQAIFGGAPLGRGDSRVILHVDMDCFFVSVLLRSRPELKEKPVAVAHNASNAKGAGSSEISSCNYPARAKGVKAGMFMMQAKELCPELVVLSYNFEAYSEASDKMYGVFLRYAPMVMAVSCDEAFLELAKGTDPMAAATQIRRSIMEETGCPASAGASTNMLLARMATKQAKPDGQFWLPPELAMHHMGPLPVQDLPGVGWKLRRRLNDAGLKSCSDLWPLSAAHMKKGLGLGEKTGQALWEACRGIDKRPVQAPPDRKSIGAEVNYGVRFDTQAQADEFLSKLAVELSGRMAAEGVVGRALTLKIMKQRDGVGLPRKYLGHGICDTRSKLLNLHRATADPDTLASHALQLLEEANVPAGKLRGIGLQMTRLDPAGDASIAGNGGAGTSGGGGAADGGKASGALHDWLTKPAGENSRTSSSAGERDDPRQTRGAGESASPGRAGTAAGVSSSVLAVEKSGKVDSVRVAEPGRTPGYSEEGAPRPAPEKRAREGGDDDAAVQRHDLPPATRHRSDGSFRISVDPGAGGEAGARAGAELSAGIRRSGSVEEGASSRVGRVLTAAVTESRSSSLVRVNGAVSRCPEREAEAEGERREVQSPRVSCGGGEASSPSTVRRPPRQQGSPERLMSPSTPSVRLAGTPMSDASSPSMSQITLSQIDSTVLRALPADLRQEVLSQLEVRRQQREDRDSHPPPRAFVEGQRQQRADHSAPGSRDKRAAVLTAPVAAAKVEVFAVQEGFDVPLRGGSSKSQQVSLDSLWTLRKLRDDDSGGGKGSGGDTSSAFDRDSLRALPLGLGLQYASLTENQRAQIARRYAQPLPSTSSSSAGFRNDEHRRTHQRERAGRDASPPRSPTSPGPGAKDRETRHHQSPPPPAHGSPPRSPTAESVSPAQIERGNWAGRSPSPPRSAKAADSELHHISLSQVDRDVLDGLPPEVREEVLRAIGSSSNAGGRLPGENGESDGVGDSEKLYPSCQEGGEEEGGEAFADERIDGEPGAGFIDLRSPCTPTSPSPSQAPQVEEARTHEGGCRRRGSDLVFEVEPAEKLRGVLRAWVGGEVRSPSQWHLELLYRYLEELVDDGRLDETATLLRCLGRLSRKADRSARDSRGATDGGGSWGMGYGAVLEAVQDLVRRRTGGASIALMC